MEFSFLHKNKKNGYDRLLLIVLVLTTPLLFLGGRLLPDTEQFKSLWNLGHIPFSLIAVLFIHNRIKLFGWKRGAWLFVGILLISIAIELTQSAIGRQASLSDIVRNFIGAGIAWFWLQPKNWLIWLGRLSALTMFVLEIQQTGNIFYSEYLYRKQLPLISNFEHSFDLRRWHGDISISNQIASDGKYSMKGVLGPHLHANIELQGSPQDWSQYQSFHVDIYNEQLTDIEIMLRIHDEEHAYGPYRWRYGDRFNKKLLLKTGWNSYDLSLREIKEAPTRRELNLKKIANIQFFVANPEQDQIIYIDNLRLN